MPSPDETSDSEDRKQLLHEVLGASLGILILLTIVKHVGRIWPSARSYGFLIAIGLQLYLPIWLIGRRGISKESLGLRLDRWRDDLKFICLWGSVTIIPFAIGHHIWQHIFLGRPFHVRIPEGLLETFVNQIAVVAIAEELFFRGYLQERMHRLWPAQHTILGAPFGWAVVGASFVFAMAHFVGEYHFGRLGPFFPALVFGWLRARTQTIVGAVGYHAFCNILGDALWTFYR